MPHHAASFLDVDRYTVAVNRNPRQEIISSFVRFQPETARPRRLVNAPENSAQHSSALAHPVTEISHSTPYCGLGQRIGSFFVEVSSISISWSMARTRR
jgi:hypothetical protein